MTTDQLSSWTERQIAAGRFSPAARRMAPEEAADQYNQAHALTPADADFMHTPRTAQVLAHDVLRVAGLEVADHRLVVLTDADNTGPAGGQHLLNPSQVEGSSEQFRLTTGEAISYDALEAALPWYDPEDF
ncbi:MAG: hypothetical protein QM658_03410 [Gordonia sp. (in: high G+C Gram-positive bacteria)]